MGIEALDTRIQAHAAGSPATAARRLKITPIAASRRLNPLETELGVRLMQRSGCRKEGMIGVVQAELAEGRRVRIDLKDATPRELSIRAVFPNARNVLPKLRVFIDRLQATLTA
jgi:DNA-binding transcriptional LysR family regulator